MMSLQNRIVRGGSYLALRQGLAILIGLGGVVALTRVIGAGSYGLYAAASGIYMLLLDLGQCGIPAYLIRKPGPPQEQDYHQAFTVSCLIGLFVSGLAVSSIPLLMKWTRLEGFGKVAAILFLVLPFHLIGLVFLARLEKALAYRKVALIEFSSQVTFYVVAIPLALMKFGVWAPTCGWIIQQLVTLVLLYKWCEYRPSFYWDRLTARQILMYGLSYSSANWIWQIRGLVNPLIVGRYLGSEYVAFVSVSTRLVESISFMRHVIKRISMAAFGYILKDKPRLTQAITEGMTAQIILLGPALVLFCFVAQWVIPSIFGANWRPVLQVLPYVALSTFTAGSMGLHSSGLFVLGKNWQVAIFNLTHVTLFVGVAAVLIPKMGLMGFNFAELLVIPTYGMLQYYTIRYIGKPDYSFVWLLWIGIMLSLVLQSFSVWWGLPFLTVYLGPRTALKIKEYLSKYRRGFAYDG